MYIRRVEIKNIKGIESFEMDFSEVTKPGWHVLIGDNGSGKTTILRCLGMMLIGDDEIDAVTSLKEFRARNWLRLNSVSGEVYLDLTAPFLLERASPIKGNQYKLQFEGDETHWTYEDDLNPKEQANRVLLFHGMFCAGYGPNRRITGKSNSIFEVGTRANFRTLFSEDESLAQTQEWLQGLVLDSPTKPEKKAELKFVIQFINSSQLLPDGATLTDKIDSQGVKIKDASGNEVYFRDASDGYRSILSLTLDLIKNMIAHFGIEKVAEHATENQIKLPGVVLIDEIDAHLHPNWQVRIGQWFTSFFPLIQFIVTTHSPLICRGSLNGQIWHLKTPGSGEKSGPVSELQRKRLVYGDILDAYDTELFGEVSASAHEEAVRLRARMLELQEKSMDGLISDNESRELQELRSYL